MSDADNTLDDSYRPSRDGDTGYEAHARIVGGAYVDDVRDATGRLYVRKAPADGALEFYDDYAALSAGQMTSVSPTPPLRPARIGLMADQAVATLQPKDGPWTAIRDQTGPAYSHLLQPGMINRPAALIRAPNDGVLVLSYYDQPLLVDAATGAIRETLPIRYQRAGAGNEGYAYYLSAAYSADGSMLAVGGTTDDAVRVYDTTTWAMISECGDPDAAGTPHEGGLDNIYGDPLFIGGDLLAIPSYTGSHAPVGQTPAANNLGSISVWDVSTNPATFVRYVMWPSRNVAPASGLSVMTRPMDIRADGAGGAYVACYNHGCIVHVGDVSAPEWTVDRVYYPPPLTVTQSGSLATFKNPYGFDVADGQLIVAPHGSDIVAVNLSDGSFAWSVAKTAFGLTGDYRSLCAMGPDFVLVADWAAAAASRVPRCAAVRVDYEPLALPPGARIDRPATGSGAVFDCSDPNAVWAEHPVDAVNRIGPWDVKLTDA